jgi:hypothetical protein
MKRIVAMLLGVLLLFQGVAWAGSDSQESTGAKVGYGVGSVVGSAVYFPFKASFCILGGIGSGFALLFAGPNTAERVINTSCRGTWAITPDVVKGNESVHFVGDAPAPPSQARN